MNETQSAKLKKLRIIITVIISVLILGLLMWDYFHGGVPSHHLLDQKNLPAISNWWSGLLLPVISWIMLGKIKTRIENQTKIKGRYKPGIKIVLWRFGIALIFGIILSVSFIKNYKLFLDNVPYLLLILSLIVPIFFSEFILGFVLGMAYTFGAILPTAFILIIAGIGFIIYKFIRPLIIKLTLKIGNKSNTGSGGHNV